ncbi:hypothetical protein C8Q74DRAFT_75847 [Fomes fomentarius]|nr:hypothetical protein C8Q74DRAFT_75847 [Fomes fomentarius]
MCCSQQRLPVPSHSHLHLYDEGRSCPPTIGACPSAALAPIKDLGTSVTSLATCATLFDLHGSTLSSEARLLACNVFEAVRTLTNMFVESAGEDYLVRTGTVHDLVEKARRDLPADNLAAVKQRWKADRGMLEDALQEINTMIEESGQGGEEELDELDDEWDELGFGSSKKMSDVELERTKKIQPLARFVTLLHKRVVPDVLGGLTVTESIPDAVNSTLDALPPKSHALVLALEEVVATLYAPQKPDALATAVSSLVEAAHKLHDSISNDLLPSTVDVAARDLGALSLDGGKSSGEKKAQDPRTWFESCRAQIDKTAKMIEQTLAGQGLDAT